MMLLYSIKEAKVRMFIVVFSILLTVLGILLISSGRKVYATSAITEPIALGSEDVEESAGKGYTYYSYPEKVLTLDDGFSLKIDSTQSALLIKADTTIILKGNATIESKGCGIESFGAVTIKSAVDENGDYVNGHLTIKSGYNKDVTLGDPYYGIYVKNSGNICVTDNALVDINGGNYVVGCSVGADNELMVCNRGAVKLTKASSGTVSTGYKLDNTEGGSFVNPIIMDKSGSVSVLKSATSIDNSSSVSLYAFTLEGKKNGDTYTLDYDGKKHSMLVNTAFSGLSSITFVPQQVNYTGISGSEYGVDASDTSYDYRDKIVSAKTTTYTDVAATSGGPVNAATYKVKYNNTELATLVINPKKVIVSGLKVKSKKKTYDGWEYADVDYSEMEISSTTPSEDAGKDGLGGIVEADKDKVGAGKAIIPAAIAYYLRKDDSGVAYFDGDSSKYKADGNVYYEGEAPFNKVAEKKIVIKDITLNNPNYKVVKSAVSDASPVIEDAGTIYPRKLDNDSIAATLSPDSFYYSEDGYSETANITKSISDSSKITKGGNGTEYELQEGEGKDYLVNPNDDVIKEVGEYEIEVTGQGNYSGTRTLTWKIEKARREITITNDGTRAYDGAAYFLVNHKAVPTGEFYYTIIDKDNNKDLTDSVESSNPKIEYEGIDGTDYEKSEEPPVNAGKYKVTVSLEASKHYSEAVGSQDFVIYPKAVKLVWHVSGANVNENGADPIDPAELIYNGTPNQFRAAATELIGEDEVNVTKYQYTGTLADGSEYVVSENAPKNAGTYTVKAVGLDNPNYTLSDTNVYAIQDSNKISHNYRVAQKEVALRWIDGEAADEEAVDEDDEESAAESSDITEYIYDAKEHRLTPEITGGVCEDENGVKDTVNLISWTYGESKDTFGNDYPDSGSAVNASNGDITVKATTLDNPDYKLPTDDSVVGRFRILPFDLETLAAGTYESHNEKDSIWAERLSYNGKVQSPVIMINLNGKDIELVRGEDADYTASGTYRASEYSNTPKVIKLAGKHNFKGSNVNIEWNIEKLSSSISIKYEGVDEGDKYKVNFGSSIEKPAIEWENPDISNDLEDNVYNHITYRYTGTLSNGETYDSGEQSYNSTVAPTEVGEYTVTYTLNGTAHFAAASDSVDISIIAAPVTISGIKAVDKVYDGTTDVELDFSEAVFDGMTAEDKEAVSKALVSAADKARGYFRYSAAFTSPDVNKSGELILDRNVDITSLAVAVNDSTPKALCNYTIAVSGNQKTASAKISPKEVTIAGIKAASRKYDGTKKAELSGAVVSGMINEDKLSVNMVGEFEDKNVSVDTETKSPVEKRVNITYLGLVAADADTKTDNYVINIEKSQKTTVATISPVPLTVIDMKAKTREYDSTKIAEIDWESATLVGIYPGDDVSVDVEKNSAAYPKDQYDSAEVSYDKSGIVIEKPGVITKDEHQIILSGESANKNYYIDKAEYTGIINPKSVKGVEWTFDEKALKQLPIAEYKSDSGVYNEEKCDPEIAFYSESDTSFTKEIPEELLVDHSDYVAKVVAVTNNNYKPDENDATITYPFMYRSEKEESNLKFTNYQKNDGKVFEITYGETLPEPAFIYDNSDLGVYGTLDSDTKKEYFNFKYSGETEGGVKYESSAPPTKAGSYTVTASIKESANYKADETMAAFNITPKPVAMISGIIVEDKVYNGSAKAVLSFDNVIAEGFLEGDKTAAMKELCDQEINAVRYTANFKQKDVLLSGTEEGAREPSDIQVDVSDLAIVHNENTDVLNNYVLADSGNQNEFYGKILRRPITIDGVRVSDKIYDGDDKAVLDDAKVKLSGFIEDDLLVADMEGHFIKTGNEEAAKDVLTDEEGKVVSKKVVITVKDIKAGNETTNVDNYCVTDSVKQIEESAKILPAEIAITGGLSVEEKLYNGTTFAKLDFSNVKFDGILSEDEDKVKTAIKEKGTEFVAYDAEYVGKDVCWSDTKDGGKEVAEAKVNAGRYGFILNDGTPQILKNYVIDNEKSIKVLDGKILPRPIVVSGIIAKNKYYDGTGKAVLDLSEVVFEGKLKNEVLTLDVSGEYVAAEDGAKTYDVIYDSEGNPKKRNINLTINSIASGDDNTVIGNYYLADAGQQKEAMSAIMPTELNEVKWSLDEKTNLPRVAFTEDSGIVKGSGDKVGAKIGIYKKSDKNYSAFVNVKDMVAGDVYVARVEATDNPNYILSEQFKNPIYTFAYGEKVEEKTKEKPDAGYEVTEKEKTKATVLLNEGLSISAKSKKITFKWGKVEGADGYLVYTATTGLKYGKAVTVKDATEYTYKYTNENKVYKAYVKAYKIVNGKQYVLATSYGLRYAGNKKDGYNVTKVKASKKSIKITAGKTKSAKAYVLLKKKNKTVKKIGKKAYLKYWSTDTKIASVTSSGKIKGITKGKCYIYVMARNGEKIKIKVTVK